MAGVISIHALLAESDRNQGKRGQIQAISIHALLAESDEQSSSYNAYLEISIHALLAESDWRTCAACTAKQYFYPRSPCGERLAYFQPHALSVLFLSTLSLRRATGALKHVHQTEEISIHALLAESDQYRVGGPGRRPDFYPRSPCGERRPSRPSKRFLTPFLSTLSLRRATFDMAPYMAVSYTHLTLPTKA